MDGALAEQTKFKNAKSIKIGLLNLKDLEKTPKSGRGIFSLSDSSFDSDKHFRFKSNGQESGARSENIFESLKECMCPKLSWF